MIADSVYWDEQRQADWLETGVAQGVGVDETDGTATNNMQSRTTSEMQGIGVNEHNRLGNLTFEEEGGPWVEVFGDYPRFEWELVAEQEHDSDTAFYEESTNLVLLLVLTLGGYALYRRTRM